MWMQTLGRSKWAVLGRWMLAIYLGLSIPGAGFAGEAPVTQATPPPSSDESEIQLYGKLFCSLKRQIDLPFKGIITSLRVHSGQPVKAGDILATYRLAPEALMAIQQRLSVPQLAEAETRLAELQGNIVTLTREERNLSRLVQEKLAPAVSLAKKNQQLQLLNREKETLQDRLEKNRQLAHQDQEVLSGLLGTSLKSGQVPREVSLKAPISGYVIWVSPELRVDAELPPQPAVQVAVMDPMLLRTQAFETEALQFEIGQSAEVTMDALPGKKFQGKVSRISWSSSNTALGEPAFYQIELSVPNPNLDLKEGLKANIILHKSR